VSKCEGEGGGGVCKCFEVLKRLFDVSSTRARERGRGRGHIASDEILCVFLVLILKFALRLSLSLIRLIIRL
jgi:hypothetical protein